MLYTEIKSCRICGNRNLVTVLDLGVMALTGVFPTKHENVEAGPLELVKCMPANGEPSCGLLQMKHNYDLSKLYGDNYGYRSGLNNSMVRHLEGIADQVLNLIDLKKNDLVLDIGSNDGTLLKIYDQKKKGLHLVGIDPTISKFESYYPDHIDRHPHFFSSTLFKRIYPNKKARVVTSIAMFYDLEQPMEFMKEVHDILADDGIWIIEQSYMSDMMENTAYDTVCHEHVEYYAFKQIQWMAERTGFKIVNVETNASNGASFRVVFTKSESSIPVDKSVAQFAKSESKKKLDDLETYQKFNDKIKQNKEQILKFFKTAKKERKTVIGYGASTKGSVILQYCGIDKIDMPCIAEVNEYKFGRYAPGTNIPIIPEEEARKLKPDYFFVLPWHFKEGITKKEQKFLKSGGHLFFPLPKPEII